MSVRVLILLVALACAGCAKAPPNLTPAGVVVWQANEATVILGNVQRTAIGLNGVQRCEIPRPCEPLFSDRNTGIVVDVVTDGLLTLRAVPSGWRATTSEALNRVAMRLDEAGRTKIAGYLQAAREAVEAIP